MPRPRHILIPDPRAWRLATVTAESAHIQTLALTPAPSPDEASAQSRVSPPVAPNIPTLPGAKHLTILLPSNLCLAAAVDTAALPRRGRADALRFALEEKLPLAAEHFAAAFAPGPAASALGIASATDHLIPLITALEDAGHTVDAISPLAFAAIPADVTEGLLLLTLDDHVDVIYLHRAQPLSWQCVDPASTDRAIAFHQLHHSDSPIIRRTVTLEAALQQFARQRSRPRIDLLPDLQRHRPGRAAGISARFAAAALIALGLTLPGSLLWRAHRYDQLTDHFRREQAAVYQARFPGPTPPAGILRVFESELKAAKTAGSQSLVGYDSALTVMHDALRNISDGADLRIRRLRVATDRIELQGDAASKNDAEVVRKALGDVRGFAAELTQLEDAGNKQVRFTVISRPALVQAAGAPHGNAVLLRGAVTP
jgi:type II secretory pathway component PulL